MNISDVLYQLTGLSSRDCPSEPDTLAYLQNTVSSSKRARFERHFARCEDCRETLAVLGFEPELPTVMLSEKAVAEQTGRVLAYIQNDERRQSVAPRKARAASGFYVSYPRLASACAVLCAILVAGIVIITRQPSPSDQAMDAMRNATRDVRYSQARVSGGFAYSSYNPGMRGGESLTSGIREKDDVEFQRAQLRLKAAEQESASNSDRAMLARVYLSRGTSDDARRALAILDHLAGVRRFETPEVFNDIGVAHFQLYRYDLAISYLSRALDKSPKYGEARFNRALALERAKRFDEAKADWQRFIDDSSDEKWTAEAREHLGQLR